MDQAIGNLIVKLTFDSSEFDSGITQANRQLRNFERATKNSGDFARQTGYSLQSSTVYVNNMKETYKALNHTLSEQSTAYNELGKQHGKDSARRLQLGAQMEQTKAKMIALNKEYDREVTNIAKANSSWYQRSQQIQNMGESVQTAGKRMQSFGAEWSKASAVVTVAGGYLGKQAMDFEKGMIDVQKTTNLTNDEIKALGDELRGLSTEMPIAIGELQGLAEAGGRFRIPSDQLAEFAETMAMVGTATDMSAEVAAEQFARLSNITGLTVDEFDNFGSALINLGNNMATTESAIMNMAMGMAGTLSSLGISDQEIIGIAAAMSSLGIESERGASSISKFFVDLETLVQSGSEDLIGFADVAGMSMDQFITKFQDDPTAAFTAFIQGLSDINAEGGSVINTLDTLGVNEIRMRDTLLRLAGGNQTLAESLKLSNQGWAEGTALQEEYDTQLNSTAAQWEIFKNKLKDLAISAGETLLPVFNDLMDNADGLIEGLKGAVEWFTNLDDSTKGFITQAALAGVAIGPIIAGLGTLVNFGGGIIKTTGAIGRFFSMIDVNNKKRLFGTLAQDITGVSGNLTTLATGATTTGSVWGGMATVLSSTGFWVVAGAAAVTLIGHLKGIQQEAANLEQINMDWGGLNLDQVEYENLNEFSKAYETARKALELDIDVTNSERFATAVDNMADSLQRMADKRIAELTAELREFQEFLNDEEIAEYENQIKKSGEWADRGTSATVRVQDITETAKAENRPLTAVERQEQSRLLNIASYAASYNSTEAENVVQLQQQLNAELQNMTSEQIQHSIDAIDGYMRDANQRYNRFVDKLNNDAQKGKITQDQADQRALVERQNMYTEYQNAETARIKADWERTRRQLQEQGVDTNTDLEFYMRQRAEMIGQSYDEYKRMVESEFSEMRILLDGQIDTLSAEMNQVQFEASERWNGFIFEMQKNNEDGSKSLYQLLKDAGATAENWNELEFALHNVDLDSNTKTIVAEALMQNSVWNDLTFETKTALVEAKGESAVREIIEMLGGDWESLHPEVKNIMANYEGAEAVEEALFQLGYWNQMTVEDKRAVLEAQIDNDALWEAIEAAGAWEDAEFVSKLATIDTNAPEAKEQITELLLEFTDLSKQDIAELLTTTNADSTTGKIKGVGRALTEIDGRSAGVSVRLNDQASAGIANINRSLINLNNRVATARVQTRNYAKGTDYHMGGLAVLGDGSKREPFLTPYGEFGISPDRDTLYNLPKGTKVWPSLAEFISKIPHFASGTQRSFLGNVRVPKTDAMVHQSTNNEINITINNPSVRNDQDIKNLAQQVSKEVSKIVGTQTKNKQKGRVATA